jgi:hypothetical protein
MVVAGFNQRTQPNPALRGTAAIVQDPIGILN